MWRIVDHWSETIGGEGIDSPDACELSCPCCFASSCISCIISDRPDAELALFGTSTTGSNLQVEMQTGSHERTLVSPLSRSSLMIGRALKEIVPTIVQALVIVGVAVPFGFRPDVAGLVVGLAVLSVFCVGLGALSYALALAVKENQWAFWGVQQTLLFPLMLLAGILLPLTGAPGWLEVASKVNPLTYVVDAERALIAGTWDGDAVAGAVAATITCVVGLVVGAKAMRASS